jgi:hypothetical protein
MMKRHILIVLCMLMLVLSACSKSKKEEAASSKTVDLGEAAADEDAGKGKGDGAAKKSSPSRSKKADKGDDSVSEKEAYRRNEEARFDENGKPKRGKPAAELEFEEKQAKEKADKAAKGHEAKEAEASAEAKKAETETVVELDFSDEAEEEVAKKEVLPARTPKPKDALSIEKLINIRELREQTGYSGALSDAWLLGQNPDARYNAMRLATDNEKQLGFSIQVWKPGNESAASKRFNDLYHQSFGGKKIKSVATDAFTASHHDIHELGFFEKSKRAAVLLSCSSDVCNLEQLKAVALIIQRRL